MTQGLIDRRFAQLRLALRRTLSDLDWLGLYYDYTTRKEALVVDRDDHWIEWADVGLVVGVQEQEVTVGLSRRPRPVFEYVISKLVVTPATRWDTESVDCVDYYTATSLGDAVATFVADAARYLAEQSMEAQAADEQAAAEEGS